MINNKKGKEHMPRPIAMRIVAFITALAMVLSVIYFNSRKDRVRAEVPAVTDVTDSVYLAGVYNNAGSATEITVNVPATGVRFLAPQDNTTVSVSEDITLYTVDNTDYYINGSNPALVGDITELAAKVDYKVTWRDNPAGTGTNPGIVTAGDTIYMIRTYDNYHTEDGTIYTPVDADAYEVQQKMKISLTTYDATGLAFAATSNPAEVTDTVPQDTADTKYYGVVSYSAQKDGGTAKEYTSLEALNAAINTVDADGTYTIKKIIKTPSTGGNKELFTEEKTGTINNHVLTSYSAAYDTTTINGDMSAATYAITVPASATISAKKDVTVSFTTDTALAIGTGVKVSASIGNPPEVSKDPSSNTYLFTVAGAPEDMSGKSPVYTVSLEDAAGNKESFTVTINYSDGKPVFSNQKVNSDDIGTDYINVNDTSTTISADVTTADTEASISKVEVYRITGTTIPDTDTPKGEATITGSNAAFDVQGSIQPGNNTYAMRAYSSYGASGSLHADSGLFKIFYDDAAPIISSDVGITQGGSTTTATQSGTTYSATVSAMSKVSVAFDVDDLQADGTSAGSGVADVTMKVGTTSQDVTPAAGSKAVSFEFTPDTAKAKSAGNSDSITISINDEAGNPSEYTITLNYVNEAADIDYEFSPTGKVGDKNYFVWDDPSSTTATVTYTIETAYKLDNTDGIIATIGSTTKNVTSSAIETETSTGWKYEVTISYNDLGEGENYKIILKVKNVNGCETEKETEIRSLDLTSPSVTGITDENGNPIDAKQWFRNLVLKVKVADGTYSSGIKKVVADGTTKDEYTVNDQNEFYAEVSKSTESTGTQVTFTIYDNANNTPGSYTGKYKVDKDAPELVLQVDKKDYDKVDGKVLTVADPVIDFSAKDPLSGLPNPDSVVFKINGNTYPIGMAQGKKLSEIIGTTVDPKKDYKVELSATDLVGNINSISTTFRCDAEKPDITGQIVTKAKKDKYPTNFNENVTLSVTVTDSNIQESDVTIVDTKGHTIKVTTDKIAEGNFKFIIKASSEGEYNIKVTATDDGGLTNTWEKSFIIDKTAPDVTTQLNGSTYTSSNSYNTTVTTGVVVTDTYEDPSDVVVTMLRDKPEGGQETINKTGKGPFTVSDDGFYKVTYVVTDKAGNKTTKEIGFTVDNTAPVNNLYVLTDNPSKVDSYHNNYVNVHNVFTEHSNQENYAYGQYYNTDVTVELNYFDYNLNSVYVTDRGTELSPTWTEKNGYGKATITLSSEGYHEIKIWTDDLSGNSADDTEVGQKIRFTIDKTSPVISTTLNGAGYAEGSGVRYLTTNGTVGVTVSDTNVDEKDLKRIYRITPPGGATRTGEDYVSPGSETYQEEADYQVQYVAVDKAGNSSSVRTVEFRVDKTAPQLSISSVGATSTAGSVSISFNVKEAFYWDMNSVTIKIYKKKDGSGETLEKTIDMKPKSSNDSTSYTFTEDAEYRIEFTAEDKCGNKATTDYTFIKDGTAPRIVLSGVGNYDKTDKNVELILTIDEDFYTSNKVTLKGTRTDIDGKKNEITFDDFAPNRSKVSELKQLFDKDGIYDIEVTSVDKAGNKSTKNVHFTIDKTPPKIGDLSKYDKKMLREFKWDIDLNKLVTDLTVCEITLYLDGVEYDGVSPIEDGSHVLKVEAVDEMGHKSSKEVTFVLDSKGPNIIVSNVEDQDVFYEAKDIGVSVQLDEDMLDEVQLNGSAVTVTDNQATMKIDKKGDYTLTAKAHDEAGNESSISIKFTFGSEMNLWMIIGIAGGIILLLLILLLIIRKKRSW